MATVLVSFIGTGSRSGYEYETTKYFFDGELNCRETSIFGSALLQHLKDNNRSVDRWLILGTDKSIWSELVKMFPDLFSGSGRKLKDPQLESQREFLEDEAFYCKDDKNRQSRISQEKLDEWQKILTDNLTNTRVICRIVGDATEPESQNLIFQSLLDKIEENNKVVFDVTHGLRNQPIITSFVLMYLRYFRNIKAENIEFYYGAKDLEGKVIKLDFCNKLLEATEAIAIDKQTGNYEKIGENLNLSENFNSNLKKLTYLDEVNRTNTEIPKQLKNEIAEADFSPLQKSLAERFEVPLYWASKETLANQLRQKALFAFERRQYYKAVLILLEAIITAYGENCGILEIADNLETRDAREKAEKELIGEWHWATKTYVGGILNNDERQIILNLKKLRNAVAHGTDAQGIEPEAVNARNAIESERKLRQIFSEANTLFAKIINCEIGK